MPRKNRTNALPEEEIYDYDIDEPQNDESEDVIDIDKIYEPMPQKIVKKMRVVEIPKAEDHYEQELIKLTQKDDEFYNKLESPGFEVNVVKHQEGKQGKKEFLFKGGWFETPTDIYEIIAAVKAEGKFNIVIRIAGSKNITNLKYYPLTITSQNYVEAFQKIEERKKIQNLGILNDKKMYNNNSFTSLLGGSSSLYNETQGSDTNMMMFFFKEMLAQQKEMLAEIKSKDNKKDGLFDDKEFIKLLILTRKDDPFKDMLPALLTQKNGDNGKTAEIISTLVSSQMQNQSQLFAEILKSNAGKSGEMQAIDTAMNIFEKAKNLTAVESGDGVMDTLMKSLAGSAPSLLPMLMNNFSGNKTQPQPSTQPQVQGDNQLVKEISSTLNVFKEAINKLNEKVEILSGNNKNAQIEPPVNITENNEIGENMFAKFMPEINQLKDLFATYTNGDIDVSAAVSKMKELSNDNEIIKAMVTAIEQGEDNKILSQIKMFNPDPHVMLKVQELIDYYKSTITPINNADIQQAKDLFMSYCNGILTKDEMVTKIEDLSDTNEILLDIVYTMAEKDISISKSKIQKLIGPTMDIKIEMFIEYYKSLEIIDEEKDGEEEEEEEK